jgi:hypothetical protein
MSDKTHVCYHIVDCHWQSDNYKQQQIATIQQHILLWPVTNHRLEEKINIHNFCYDLCTLYSSRNLLSGVCNSTFTSIEPWQAI